MRLALPLLFLLAFAAPASAAVDPLGIPCTDENGVRFCEGNGTDQRVASFDGVPLDVNVTLPPAAEGDGPFPTIAMLHGWGGNKTSFEKTNPEGSSSQTYHYNNVWFAQRGYAVVTYSARGWGNSCGAPPSRTPDCFQQATNQDASAAGWNHLKDKRREARDTQTILGKLVDQGVAKPDALGVTGISYGGGESIELAYLRDRVQLPGEPARFEPWVSPEKKIPLRIAAAFPRWPWSDLVSSLLPNGRFLDFDVSTADDSRQPLGVPIQSYIEGLYALGSAGSFYAPPGVDQTADLTNWHTRVLAGEPPDPYALAIADQIYGFHQGFGTPTESGPAPLLIQNGWTDDLFPPAEALRVYNTLRAADSDADVALQLADLGHSRGSNKRNVDVALNDAGTRFLDKHLRGTNEDAAPKPGSVTAFTQTCPKPADGGGPFTASSWRALHPGATRFAFPEEQTISSGGGDPAVGSGYDPIAGTSDACKQVDEGDAAPGTAVYRLPPSEGFTLMGLPTVAADVATTGVHGQIASRLWDVAPDGKQTLIARGVYRLEDGQTGPVVFQLRGNGWRFERGHVPKLELLGQDAPHFRPSNGTFSVALSNVVVELPALERPRSSEPFGQLVSPTLGAGGTVRAVRPRLRVSVKPRRVRAGASRRRFRVRVRARVGRRMVAVRRARVHFAGRHVRTGRRGRAVLRVRLRAPGVRRVRATKFSYRRGSARVRVLRRR